ncbi:protein Teyrha-meyrha-like isoform X2 [Anopheles albimanus]|uniref:protein Teyrha-meyrha-like isoform X2 n=1 Tax=Anopheles albimanus TaxID=7167 RepID=UPI0016411D70|nr:protein Teyrha-meyrha-like isoform X2 [Anopheles albimanus]
MDNPTYGSAHMSSPALVVFSQATNGLSDALRIQRPFHSQLPDAKDLHHLSLMSGYGAHLLHGFQPHFLHPLNPAVSTASGTSPFGGGGAFVKPFPSNLPLPSAFAPPKCLGFGIDQGLLFGSSGGSGSESFRTDSSSPACTSLSPPPKDESMEGQTSEEGDRDRDRICSPPERSPETPGFRRIGPPKKSFVGTPPPNGCPICGVQLSPSDLETHFSAELTRLTKMTSHAERIELRRTLSVDMHTVQNNLQGRTSRWETFKNIRNKRQDRLRGKLRKRKFDGEDGFGLQLTNINCQSCPVCHGRLQRTQEEIAQHIEECVRKTFTILYPALKQQHQHQHQQAQQTQQAQQAQQAQQQQQQQSPAGHIHPSGHHHHHHHPHHHHHHQQTGGPTVPGGPAQPQPPPSSHPPSSGHASPQDEDETVDVESYGDETSNGAINMSSNVIHHTSVAAGGGGAMLHHHATNTSNNNNNNNIIKPDTMNSGKHPLEESAISSLSSIVPHWDRAKGRLGMPLGCKPPMEDPRPWATGLKPRLLAGFEGASVTGPPPTGPPPTGADHTITRVTPTSSDQRIDVDYDPEHGDHSQDMVTDNDEEVIVDNTDDEECVKRPTAPRPSQLTQLNGHGPTGAPMANGHGGAQPSPREDKNSTEEATSSVEIDSVTDSMASRTAGTTPNSDSYVSTSESAEPSSKAQVLEELKARIRELEGSPHYKCFICKEKCKTLIISKICGHYLCEECWVTESDSSKSCPRCKIITANSDFRKIHA